MVQSLPDLAIILVGGEDRQSQHNLDWIMFLFAELARDDSPDVRRRAVENCTVLAKRLPAVVEQIQPGDPNRLGHLVLCQVMPVLFALVGDPEPQVRNN